MNTIKLSGLLFIASFFLQGCMADLRTTSIKKEGITEDNINKGKAILEAAWKNHGFEHMERHEVYSFQGIDEWKGMLGRIGNAGKDREGLA